jgi:DNA invertase Pin-like site-specific DNA recombinase
MSKRERHIAIYVRVSSKQQSTRSQLPDLERWAAAQDEPIKWYTDHVSGKSMQRPQWTKLEEAMRVGKVSAIVVWRLDRLGRTASGLTKLFDELQLRKINLVSLKEGIDLSTPAGRMMAGVLASLAQYETEVRGERVVAGIKAKREAAEKAGRPWKKPSSKKGQHYKLTGAMIKAIQNLHADGESISQLSRTYNVSRPTIYKLLAKPPA